MPAYQQLYGKGTERTYRVVPPDAKPLTDDELDRLFTTIAFSNMTEAKLSTVDVARLIIEVRALRNKVRDQATDIDNLNEKLDLIASILEGR